MKLPYYQLESHLAKTLSPIYIVGGEELFLKQEAVHLIRKKAQQAGFAERIRITSESDYDWDELYTLLHANSLFGTKRLIEIDFRDMQPDATAKKILENYVAQNVMDNVLLIDVAKIDSKLTKTAWYKALEKNGCAISVYPIPRERLPQWILQRAKKYKLSLTTTNAALLADYAEGNLGAAAQMIEKIYLLKPEVLNDETIYTILTDESHFTLFDFVDFAISGQINRTLHVLDHLKNSGTEPILILWAITRELRNLASFADAITQGTSLESLLQKKPMFPRHQAAIRTFLKKFSNKDCWHLLEHAATIDQITKGAHPGNIWDSLQLFCLRLGYDPTFSEEKQKLRLP